MSFIDDLDLRTMTPGDASADWLADLDFNADRLDDILPGMFVGPHTMAVDTPPGTLVHVDPSTGKYKEAIFDNSGEIKTARVVGMTIERVRTGIADIRGVTIGRAPFNHGGLNYGTLLYVPDVSNGVAGVLTPLATSGIPVARAARGNWVYLFPFLSASLD